MLKFKSKYSPQKSISSAQYISEIVCENAAKRQNRSLPLKFWQLEEWRQYYIFQLKLTNDLLKVVDEKILIEFVQSKNIYNLSPKWILEAVEKLQRIAIASAKRYAEKKIDWHEQEYIENSRGLAKNNIDLSYLN